MEKFKLYEINNGSKVYLGTDVKRALIALLTLRNGKIVIEEEDAGNFDIVCKNGKQFALEL